MSKRTKRSAKDKSVSSSVIPAEPVQPSVFVGVPVTPTDPAQVPFPEWNDQDVNTEKWDALKPKTQSEQPAKPPSNPHSHQTQAPSSPSASIYNVFVDPQHIPTPSSIDIRGWLRPDQVFPNETIVVYEELSNYPDLLTANKHIVHVQIFRDFITSIGTLMYLGDCQPWPFEVPMAHFYPVTEELPWRPHHHIYSIGKAAKGTKHNPQVNVIGKYFVRLFWMGCWRKVIVDDLLPVDHSNHVLLPSMPIPPPVAVEPSGTDVTKKSAHASSSRADNKESKSKMSKLSDSKAVPEPRTSVQLWPFLLCKAVMKLASFTMSEIWKDFDIISCFTGWTMIKMATRHLTSMEIWETCSGYTNHYTWEELEGKPKGQKPKRSKSKSSKSSKSNKSKESKNTKDKSSSKSSKSSKKSSGSKKGKKAKMSVPNFLDDDDGSRITPFHLMASLTDLRTMQEDEVKDFSPCWSHLFLIDQSRDIPLIRPEIKPELARWKRFRWISWAERNGILVELQTHEQLKCFKIISTFKKFYEYVVYEEPTEQSIEIKESVDIVESIAKHKAEIAKTKKDKGKGGGPKSKSKEKQKKGSKSEKSGKSSAKSKKSKKDSKKSKNSKGKKRDVEIVRPPDPSFWTDFNDIAPYISCLYIYVKPSQFLAQCRVSDLTPPLSSKGSGKEAKDGRKSPKVKPVPFQIAPQPGYTSIVYNTYTTEMCRNKQLFMFFDTLDTKYVVLGLSQVGYQQYNESKSQSTYGHAESHTYVTMENFNWQTLETCEETVILKTCGQKAAVIQFEPGRIMQRIWIKSCEPYVLLILSDTPMCVGSFESIAECMSLECQRVTLNTNLFCTLLGQRFQSFGSSDSLECFHGFYVGYDVMHPIFTRKQNLIAREASQLAFRNLLFDYVPSETANDCCFALAVLYLNPSFSKPLKSQKKLSASASFNSVTTSLSKYYVIDLSEEENYKRVQKAATKIQAFFRRAYILKLKSLCDESNPRFAKVYESLKYMYNVFLSVKNRLAFGTMFFRQFLFETLDRSLAEKYFMFNDMQNVVNLKHVIGTAQVAANSWMLVCRYTFFVVSPREIIIRFMMVCNLDKYVIRTIDNDTQRDAFKYTNTSPITSFRANAEGYTVICYGWSSMPQSVTWKSTLITLKTYRDCQIAIQDTDLMRDTLYFLYRPNVNHRILRCLVTIKRNSYLTFRLSASSSNVLLQLKCTDPWGNVVQALTSRGSVILPLMKLLAEESEVVERVIPKKFLSRDSSHSVIKNRKANVKASKLALVQREEVVETKETVYILEAFVVDKTWPLTPDEWRVVDNHKLASFLYMREYPRIAIARNSYASRTIPAVSEDAMPTNDMSDLTNSIPKSISFQRSMLVRYSNVVDAVKPPKGRALREMSVDNDMSDNPKPIAYQKRQVLQRNSEPHGIPEDVQAPFWCLQTFVNKGDSVTVNIDSTREQQIKAIKEAWYRDDPDRYHRSQELRKQFLYDWMVSRSIGTAVDLEAPRANITGKGFDFACEDEEEQEDMAKEFFSTGSTCSEQYIVSTDFDGFFEESQILKPKLLFPLCQENDEAFPQLSGINLASNKMFISPESFINRLDNIDLSKYMRPEKIQNLVNLDRRVLTQADWADFLCIRETEISDFEDYLLVFREDMNRLISDDMATNEIMNKWLQGIREESESLLEAAYKLIDDYAASLTKSAKAEDGGKSKSKKGKSKHKKK